ncbi:MAG: hypothetical protein E6J90_35660 [Deltaproteobacteria bacterium]|nr:MAG: hypothetical protein E6J90_35660 [Deltaproteobacteria bacterium]
MMQIGQILVAQRWVDPVALARALADQPDLGLRICSLLIQRGQLDPDHAARALAEQHRVPGVLQRHLEHRDPALARFLPAALARTRIALPIGRTGAGELIVCVRDPGAALHAEIAAAVAGRVVIAVAPALQLEQLVQAAYAAPEPDEHSVEVDLSTRPIAIIHDIAPAPPDEVDVDLSTRQIPVIGDPLAHLGSLTLVELDDVRVARDPSQSGQHAALPRTATGSYLPPRTATGSYPSRATTGPQPRTATGSHPRTTTGSHAGQAVRPGSTLPFGFRGPTLDSATSAIDRAASLEAAADAAMHWLAGRFRHAVWFTLHEGAALGERGHGDQLTIEVIQAIAIPLAAPSIQDRLTRSLGYPSAPAALPVEVDAQVACVIAVGDPVDDPATATRDLEQLGRALARALQRIAAR